MTAKKYEFLSDEDVESFLTTGMVCIRNAFTSEQGEQWSRDTFVRLGYDPHDPETWAQTRIHMPSLNHRPVKDFSPRAWGAICELCGGEDRIQQPAQWGDSFIVNLGAPEHAETWQPPTANSPGWHKDGDFFRHFLDSPEQGLLTIILWSDVLPRGGATFVATDSVPVVARFMADKTEGTLPNSFGFKDLIAQCHQFIEATGKTGDVYLMHPYILHASSENALRLPRLITNPPIHLKEPMNFDRPDGDYSMVERTVLNALGVERFPFTPTVPRERIIPERVRRQQEVIAKEKARLAAAGI